MANSIENLGNEQTLFLHKPDWATPTQVSTDLKRELQQYPPGAMGITHISSAQAGYPLHWEMGYTNLDKQDEYNLLDFFIGRQGRLKRFWVPYWHNTYRLYSSISNLDTTCHFDKTLLPQTWVEDYMRIFIQLKNGDIVVRRVTAINDLGNSDQLLVATNFDRDIVQSDIAYLSTFILARFDIDSLEFEHRTTDASSCTIRLTELLGEYNNVGT